MIIFKRHANLKYTYGNRKFRCRGFYVSTAGNNKIAVQRYVKNQLKEDMIDFILNEDFEQEVIAFLNYKEGGIIYVGINKNGQVVGVENTDLTQLKIKEKIKIIYNRLL